MWNKNISDFCFGGACFVFVSYIWFSDKKTCFSEIFQVFVVNMIENSDRNFLFDKMRVPLVFI